MKKQKNYSPIKVVLRDYTREALRYKWLSIPGLLLPGIGSTFSYYVPPLVIALAIRDFDASLPSSIEELLPYLMLFAGAWLIGELCWHIAFLLIARYQSQVITNLYIYALDELMKKDADFFNNNFTGSLTKRITTYAGNFERFLDTLTFNVAASILPLSFALVILWTISPILVVLLISVLSLSLFAVIPLIKKRMRLVRIREAASSRTSGHIADVIGNISAVQAFGHEEVEHKNHVHNTKAYTKAMYDAWHYDTSRIHRTLFPVNALTNIAGLIVAVLTTSDSATMAAVFVTFNYFVNTARFIFEFNTTYRSIESSLSGAAEYTELLETSSKISDTRNASAIHIEKGEIIFDNVHFSYPETKNIPLFSALQLRIAPGQRVALVGHSGGGKTSITRLLLRFVDLDEGEIRIDNQNIARTSLKSLRQSIAYVPQEPAMFHRSITENIRYGRLDATDDEVYEAAKKAHATEFIEKLPQGFDTLVGERGVKLSGGQRQRIAIARAILKDAPILLLDEATSALDSESEKLIQQSLETLMKGRTSIVIAHRLSTIAKLDRIVVLEKGKIIEDGTHTELLKQKGVYASLWAHQSGGFIEE
jgi:ATP-binding cassette, subfamily B, bacterial